MFCITGIVPDGKECGHAMKRLFDILPVDFYKPLTSKYRREYADCIMRIFNVFKPEISYGVNREIVVRELTDYFEADDVEMSFDDEVYVSDAREKANGVISVLKKCGWIEYEQETNHQINIVLCEYAVPIIESMNRVVREEEAEYQGIISQIHASLQNSELYNKPYELIIKGVQENTERLLSELKKLNASIKRHMDRQTNDMGADEILDHFFEYHKNIGSKAYLRMKTSENIAYFRTAVVERIEWMRETEDIMECAVKGYMEVEEIEDSRQARDEVISILNDIKSSFYRLDDIIEEIDRKHTRYMRSAVMRARFLLATGNNLEGKLLRLLDMYVQNLNAECGFEGLFSLYPQNFISPESLQTIPVTKKMEAVSGFSGAQGMSEADRLLYKEILSRKNRNRFSRKNINEYVVNLLGERKSVPVTEVPVESARDFIRIIYISIYAGNRSNNYTIKRSDRRVEIKGFSLPYFDIIKK
ncbi:hypothetical protein D7X88_09280 [bacterium C-53]|nr:hypothetical protein [Lachnospiraceae bacterium]NBI03232.1 hypothetical protein [Lachnospiraceae bacterium]RKJ10116.1 hypothetical protein D7X88_09280 [bacterium C-53]